MRWYRAAVGVRDPQERTYPRKGDTNVTLRKGDNHFLREQRHRGQKGGGSVVFMLQTMSHSPTAELVHEGLTCPAK